MTAKNFLTKVTMMRITQNVKILGSKNIGIILKKKSSMLQATNKKITTTAPT